MKLLAVAFEAVWAFCSPIRLRPHKPSTFSLAYLLNVGILATVTATGPGLWALMWGPQLELVQPEPVWTRKSHTLGSKVEFCKESRAKYQTVGKPNEKKKKRKRARNRSEALVWSWGSEFGQEVVWNEKGRSGRRDRMFWEHVLFFKDFFWCGNKWSGGWGSRTRDKGRFPLLSSAWLSGGPGRSCACPQV